MDCVCVFFIKSQNAIHFPTSSETSPDRVQPSSFPLQWRTDSHSTPTCFNEKQKQIGLMIGLIG